MKPYVLGAIFARGGSKGVPRKNIRPLAGKPLIAYSIEVALASTLIDRVIVSTDDEEIASVARRHGADIPFMRPAALATDSAPELMAWQHALRVLQAEPNAPHIDIMVSVPTTSPMRRLEDVDACIRALQESDADVVITVRAADRSPYFNMVTLDDAGCARLMIPPKEALSTRQSAPKAYDITTVAYAARAPFVMEASALFEGTVKAIIIPCERALDIDTERDFQYAEFLMTAPARAVR